MSALSAAAPAREVPRSPGAANLIDVEGDVEWVDRSPPGFDPAIAQAWGEFAAHYADIAAELFDGDPDFTARIAQRGFGRV